MNTFQYFDAAMVQPLMDAIGVIEGRKITQEEFARKIPTGTRSVSGWVSKKENSPKKMTMASRQGCVDIADDYKIDLATLKPEVKEPNPEHDAFVDMLEGALIDDEGITTDQLEVES